MATPSAEALAQAQALYAGNQTAQAYNPNGPSQDALNYWAGQIDANGAKSVQNAFTGTVQDYAAANPLPGATTTSAATPTTGPTPTPLVTTTPATATTRAAVTTSPVTTTAASGIINAGAPVTGTVAPATTTVAPQDYASMVSQAYGQVGRVGFGTASNQIDQAGYDYWLGQLQSGKISPADFNKTFLTSAATSNGGTDPTYQNAIDAAKAALAAGSSVQAPTTQAVGATPVGTGYTATNNVVDPKTSTVSGQVAGIIAANSPLMQQAQAKAMQAANDRGLINSSIAVGAGQDAVLSAAEPIAAADASTYANAAAQNAQAANTAAGQTASNITQASLTGAQLATSASQSNLTASTTQYTAALQADSARFQANSTASTQLAVAGMSEATQRAVAQMSNASQAAISSAHDSAALTLSNSTKAQDLFNQYLMNVGNIDANATMDMAAKQSAIQTQTDAFNGAIKAIKLASPGVPDVSSILTFGAATPAATTTGAPAPTTTTQP